MQALSDCIKEIRNDSNISTLNEAQVRRSVIERILAFLGWDMYNYNEVKLEYGVGTRRVDYTLQINRDNEVFIEAKKPGEKLENHQEQLLDYSFKEGVDLAILTNGIEWWFYLPLKKGAWNDRKFYTIDIRKQEIEHIVDKFGLLLSQQNVKSGKAVQHAESILKSSQREKILEERLPEAWNKVIKNAVSPDSLLVDLLAETAEEVCGFKLESDEILRFIRDHYKKWILSPELKQEAAPTTTRPIATRKPRTEKQTEGSKRMQIGDDNYELKYKYEILVNTANWLIDNGHLKSSECPVKLTSRAKIYFINRMPERAPDLKFWRPQKLKNGLFIEADRSDIAIENAQKLLKKYGYDPEMLKIEYTDILKFEDHRTSQKRETMQMRTEVAEFHHRVLLININRQFREGASLDEVYEATRFAWKISKSRAEKAEVILATYQGEIKAAFIADEWLATTSENFPDRKTSPGRFGFTGREASPDIQELYVGKRVPDELRKRGVANPIRYVNY